MENFKMNLLEHVIRKQLQATQLVVGLSSSAFFLCLCPEFLGALMSFFTVAKTPEELEKEADVVNIPNITQSKRPVEAPAPAVNCLMREVEIILIEDAMNPEDSQALILSFNIDLKAKPDNEKQVIAGGVKNLQIVSAYYLESKRDQTPYQVLKRTNLEIELTTDKKTKSEHFLVSIGEIYVKISPAIIRLLSAVASSYSAASTVQDNEKQVIAGGVKNLQIVSAYYLESKRDQTPYQVLKRTNLEIELTTDKKTKSEHFLVSIGEIYVKISPAIIRLLSAVASSYSAASTVQDGSSTARKAILKKYPNYWQKRKINKSKHWWFNVPEEEQEDFEPALDVVAAIDHEQQGTVKMDTLIVTLEAGVGDRTVPMVLLECAANIVASQWSALLAVDADLRLQVLAFFFFGRRGYILLVFFGSKNLLRSSYSHFSVLFMLLSTKVAVTCLNFHYYVITVWRSTTFFSRHCLKFLEKFLIFSLAAV
ncbi:unnamed protein product [Gongylonema pulchrum]|uniref:Vacuolar protein sorting 13 homolog C n=1 Tax=Gongylonema pulchrum TaxID=637853 RepID=A0A183E9Y0_9BILA|nr:unnamed protein product [Gongylonema pulchrum]